MTSERVEQLDPPAEVFYRRLLSKVDDHGLYDARPSILRANLYPLRIDRVREADISRWMAACQKAGLIALYENGGKPYLMALDTKWEKRSAPKFPLPPANTREQPETGANTSTVVVVEVEDVVDKRRRSAFAPPEWIPADAWKAFEEHRQKMRKHMTDKARQLIVAELEKLKPADPVAILEQSIRNGWQDVFPIRAQKGNGHAEPEKQSVCCAKCKRPITGVWTMTGAGRVHDTCWN